MENNPKAYLPSRKVRFLCANLRAYCLQRRSLTFTCKKAICSTIAGKNGQESSAFAISSACSLISSLSFPDRFDLSVLYHQKTAYPNI
jgi:hypothetical protein